MTLQKPTLIIFDMDGTTVRHINPKLLHALERADDAMFWINKKLRRSKYEVEATPPNQEPRPRLLVHRAIHKFRNKDITQIVEPCPGVIDALNQIQSLGIPMAIVSNGLGKGYGHDILQKFDLEKYFKVDVFREDFTHSKPHPEPLLKALEMMDFKAKPTDVIWCIGDRKKDILAALALKKVLGCCVEPLSYGIDAAISVLKNAVGTDHILTTYADLQTKLNEVFKT